MACGIGAIGLALINLVRRYQADTETTLLPLILVERGRVNGFGILDAAEPLWKLRMVLEGFKMAF